jgi:hypothetical protein
MAQGRQAFSQVREAPCFQQTEEHRGAIVNASSGADAEGAET